MDRIKTIKPLDKQAQERSKRKWNDVAKPLHSLGLLEDIVIKISGIFSDENFRLDKRIAVIMCADNGVVCEGVSQSGQSVTAVVANAIANGTSNINVLMKKFDSDVIAVDIGMKESCVSDKLVNKKTAYGTDNIAKGRAMTRTQALQAIKAGIDIASDCKKNGYKIIVTGEMGIGNTTTAAAMSAAILSLSPEEVTGRGAGLDSEGLKRKINVVRKAIKVNKPDINDPVDLIAKLGGFDIAGMTGLFLGGAVYRIPIVIDGFISAAAAAAAYLIEPRTRDFMIASHVSKEPCGRKLLDFIGVTPVINAGMHLGEGTGGALLLPLLDGAMEIYDSSHRFEQLSMERYEELC